MVETGISVGGDVVFWTLSQWYSRSALAAELDLIGLAGIAPSPRPIVQCLRAALAATFRGRKFDVKPLKDKSALEVVRIDHVDESHNSYTQVLSARITEDDQGNPRIVLDPYETNVAQTIMDEFNDARGLVSGESVSEMLTTYALKLNGTRLRPAGGIYWLPHEKMETWRRLTNVVEMTAARGKCACHVIHHEMDVDAVRAVKEAIENEMTSEAKKIWEEVSSGELGQRALANRQEQAEAMSEKLSLYESLLSSSLEASRTIIENARNAAAAAAMLASVTEAVA